MFFLDNFGTVDPFPTVNCFLKAKGKNSWGTFAFFYIPLWISFLFNISCLYKTYSEIRVDESQKGDLNRKQWCRILIYPLFLIICWISDTIDKVHIWFQNDSIEIFDQVDIAFVSLAGIFNSCFFYFTYIER